MQSIGLGTESGQSTWPETKDLRIDAARPDKQQARPLRAQSWIKVTMGLIIKGLLLASGCGLADSVSMQNN